MAIGDTLTAWDATASRPPATDYPSLDVRNGHVVLDFDSATDEATDFEGLLPAHYGGGGLQVVITWSVTPGDDQSTVTWEAAFERHSRDGSFNLDTDDFGTAVSTATAAHSDDSVPQQTSLTLTAGQAADPAAGDSFRLRITRTNAAGDNIAADAELMRVELREA